VSTLGGRAIDRRTRIGRALAEKRSELIRDLGGADNLSKQELALVDEAIITMLLLGSVNAWLMQQATLVNKRSRSVLPAVRDRVAGFVAADSSSGWRAFLAALFGISLDGEGLEL